MCQNLKKKAARISHCYEKQQPSLVFKHVEFKRCVVNLNRVNVNFNKFSSKMKKGKGELRVNQEVNRQKDVKPLPMLHHLKQILKKYNHKNSKAHFFKPTSTKIANQQIHSLATMLEISQKNRKNFKANRIKKVSKKKNDEFFQTEKIYQPNPIADLKIFD